MTLPASWTAPAALLIFVLTFACIIAGEKSPRKVDRPTAALIGAVLLVVCGVLSHAEAIQAIDWATIALLLGMMVVIHFATESGLLDRLAQDLLGRSAGSPTRLLWLVSLASGVLSALFVNDTICLLLTPLVLTSTRRLRLPVEPYLLALATSSNVGSMMTLTGNPQNMLIGQSSGWTWGNFALRMVPIGLICLALNAGIVGWLYRKQIGTAVAVTDNADSVVDTADTKPYQPRLAIKTLIVLVGLLVAFLAGAPLDISALAAAGVLLVLANRPPEEAFATVDWALLLFFAGLFVVVAGVTKAEGTLIARLTLSAAERPDTLWGLTRFSLASIIGSNIFSNVPFVMLLRGAGIAQAPNAKLLWLALASSSTLAGNLTLVGSVANLIVAQRAARGGAILSFTSFLRIGVVTTLVTVVVSTILLWLYFQLGWI